MACEEAVAHLRRSDPALQTVIDAVGPCTLKPHRPYYRALVGAVVAQQISTAAARSVFAKLDALLQRNGGFKPAVAARMSETELRAVGLSRQKAAYVRDLSGRFADGRLSSGRLARADDAQIVDMLVAVKGIGQWTAEMFLMFSLNRPDILPVGDLGIQEAIRRLHDLEARPGPEQMKSIAEPWRPWRTVACWYLWRSLRKTPMDV